MIFYIEFNKPESADRTSCNDISEEKNRQQGRCVIL